MSDQGQLKVRFLDLRVTDPAEHEACIQALKRVMNHGQIILGPEVKEFEREISSHCAGNEVVGVSSGTDALYLALRALDIGSGDEVITTSLSWIATANTIALTGARPVFADIGEDLNIDPQSIAPLVNDRTKAILPVHYTGRVCDMTQIGELAQRWGLRVIEDCAQAFGASQGGRPVGTFGDFGCFSMNCMKPLAALGEAGAITISDDKLYERVVRLRYAGTVDRETCVEPSLNCRLDTVQAAFLLERLRNYGKILARRREIAARYTTALAGVVKCPLVADYQEHVFYTYTIQAESRDALKQYLTACGIECKIQHPILMPEQPAYRSVIAPLPPNAVRLRDRVLCIPANEKLTDSEVDYVAGSILSFYESGG